MVKAVRTPLLALVLLGSLAGLGVRLHAPDHGSRGQVLTASSTRPGPGCDVQCGGHDFTVVVDDVPGLYPGRRTTIGVSYRNPHGFALWIVSATLRATLVPVPGTSRCSAAAIVTGTYGSAAGVRVPAHGRASVQLPFGLRPSAPDDCQRARWTVAVTARAVR